MFILHWQKYYVFNINRCYDQDFTNTKSFKYGITFGKKKRNFSEQIYKTKPVIGNPHY